MSAFLYKTGYFNIPASTGANVFLDFGFLGGAGEEGVYVQFFSTNNAAQDRSFDVMQIFGHLTATQQFAIGTSGDRENEGINSDCKSHAHADACFLKMDPATTTVLAKASLGTSGFADGGVYLNWSVVDASADYIGYQVWGGTQPKFDVRVKTATNAAWSLTGVPFKPEWMQLNTIFRATDFSVTPFDPNNARWGLGETDGLTQRCYSTRAQNAVNPSVSAKHMSNTKILVDLDTDGTILGDCTFSNFTSDGADFSSGLVNDSEVLIVSSRGLQYFCGEFQTGADPLIVTGVPFQPKQVTCHNGGVGAWDTTGLTNYVHSLGAFDVNSGLDAFSVAYAMPSADTSPDARTRFKRGALCRLNGGDATNDGAYEFTNMTSDGFELDEVEAYVTTNQFFTAYAEGPTGLPERSYPRGNLRGNLRGVI